MSFSKWASPTNKGSVACFEMQAYQLTGSGRKKQKLRGVEMSWTDLASESPHEAASVSMLRTSGSVWLS